MTQKRLSVQGAGKYNTRARGALHYRNIRHTELKCFDRLFVGCIRKKFHMLCIFHENNENTVFITKSALMNKKNLANINIRFIIRK